MRRGFAVASAVFLVGVCQTTSGATWYVDASVFAPGDGTSWEKAFGTIQRGIDAAFDGDMVIVAEGTYVENIKFNGTDIALTSTDPFHPAVVGKTIIDGGKRESVLRFAGTENETCVLSGFTIRNGWGKNGGGIYGGTPDSPTKATIRNNVITENRATKDWPDGNGGGIAFCDGLIEHNRILGNAARHGGGLYGCHGTIRNNVIVGNSAELNGGGLHACQGTVENNTIVRNGAEYGGGLHSCDGIIRNCIIWGNGGGNELIDCNSPRYCCIWLWTGGGEGNISQYPHFVDAARGDFHLKSWSPCIDAGDPTSPFSQEPEPNGGRINMGAYGNTLEATCASQDSDQDGLPDEWELELLGSLAHPGTGDADSDGISNIEEYRRGLDPASSAMVWYVDAVARESGDGMMWETAFRTIQEGLDAADDGDTVLVSPGTYLENVEFSGEDIILRSSDPDNPSIVESTVIDGAGSGSVVGFFGTESESCVLTGFTIRNGSAMCGGGIRGDGTRAAVRNNSIISNSAEWAGGGLYGCDGTVEGNTISHNYAFEGGGLAYCGAMVCDNSIIGNTVDAGGGGLYGCSGTIERNQIAENWAFDGGGLAVCDGSICHNTVTSNSAEANGGGLYGCNGAIQNNLVIANKAKVDGGGLYSCAGTVQNNTINANSAEGDGGGLARCDGTVQNNVVTVNSAKGDGGGLYSCGGAIESNTVYGNLSEGKGSGLYGCNGIILNCIIWGNRGGDQVGESSLPTYCSIENWAGGGEGNVAYYPYFVDSAHGDYHLQGRSPCIDAGDPTSPFSNEPDPNGGRIDLGAYGNTSEATSRSPDSDSDGLPDDWEIELFGDLTQGPNDDPDADLILNIDEYRRGLNPGAWHVDAQVVSSGDGRSWEKAFKTIQEGIDAASEGETVVVAQGIYVENIRFNGKNITLRTTDPLDPVVVAGTIIDGNRAPSVVTFDGTENETCVLSGFTIRNGHAARGGGICGEGTRATIQNDGIAENSAGEYGAGLYDCDGTIRNNRITGNSAEQGWGGGLAYCDGTIQNNTVASNSAAWEGGGLDRCNGTIQNNTITGNSAGAGGGLSWCNGTIQNNTIAGNWADGAGGGLHRCNGPVENNTIANNSGRLGGGLCYCQGLVRKNAISGNSADYDGGGLRECNGTIQNNAIVGNRAGYGGGGLYRCDGTIENNTIANNSGVYCAGVDSCTGTIRNCIIWANTPFQGWQVYGSSLPAFSCIQGWTAGGEGNTPYYPYFVNAASDYHLFSWSPCIDAGDPASPFSNEPEPNGGRIDMGAYGNTPEATSKSPDTDSDRLPDDWEREFLGNLLHGPEDDPDGDLVPNLEEYRRGTDPLLAPGTWYVDASVQQSGSGQSWNEAFKTIQEGVHAASEGGIVIVAQGTYAENIQFHGVNIILTSTNPENKEVVAKTIVDGGGKGSVVTFAGTEDETCVLSGFTIRNGAAEYGGGIYGARSQNGNTRATIENNVITGNSAESRGGGLANCDGAILCNTITSNSVTYWGGGLAECGGEVRDNLISENSAQVGGGLADCDGMIRGNTVADNSATGYGGGLFICDGTIQNNLITRNSATGKYAYGGGLANCLGTIRNNIVSANLAVVAGGGLRDCSGTIENNTIVQNSAGIHGGGLTFCQGSMRNCIIWGNTAGEASQLSACSVPTYSCIQNWQEAGSGNISAFPYFVDSPAGEYHLKSCSPCIDAGDPGSEFSNEPEPNGGRVDMGAYGNTPEATSKSPDTDGDALPDDWEMAFFGDLAQGPEDNPDGDSLSNIEEYRRGSDPTSPLVLWYVDGSVTAPGDGTSWETAFKTIQEGIDAASEGDVVFVGEGTYFENIQFRGKNVALTSTDPLNPEVVAKTVIDGGANGSVVSFAGAENEMCILSGFTIRNGRADHGGGIAGRHTRATIQSNVIVANFASAAGAGLFECDGTIRYNTIRENSTNGNGGGLANCLGTINNNAVARNLAYPSGGGLYECDGTIENNSIVGNSAFNGGGGLSFCGGIIQNNTIAGNSAVSGGGLYLCDGTIQNNLIVANSAEDGGGLSDCSGIIQNNRITCNSGGWSGGGLYQCHGMIQNNTITANSATGYGGGLYGCGGTVENNTITGNSANSGGGVCGCNGTIRNNTLVGNSADSGGGLYQCSGMIQNNTIAGNSAQCYGGGLYQCTGMIENNTITGNSARYYGGGLEGCGGTIENNTIVNNSADEYGGGLNWCWGGIRNCIIWGNTAQQGPQLDESSVPTYSCIEGWTDGGDGNIALNPEFVCPDGGDFHLMPLSPCIDAGDPASDFSNEPEPNGGRINMGAYGNTREATCSYSDTDSDRLADEWEIRWFGDLRYDGTSDPDGDRILNATEFRYGWDPSVASEALALNVVTAKGYQTIQAGIWESEGGTIVVYPSIYKENLNFAGKNIILRTADPSDNPLGAQTIIDGGGPGAVITLSGSEDWSCAISGFVIRNGTVGILGGTAQSHTYATIRNNLIVGNRQSGVKFCDGAIENNTIVGNGSGGPGAGLDDCKGTIVNCIIWGNGGGSQLLDSSVPRYSCIEGWSGEGEGNIPDDPRFVSPDNGDFRLLRSSPCIDTGETLNWGLFGRDTVGGHRQVYGGKSLNMDMGAYEYYINDLSFGPGADGATLTWSSFPGSTYSVFYSQDLLTWDLAEPDIPSAGFQTTFWIDDGSKTGVAPSVATRRFYRVLENPQ